MLHSNSIYKRLIVALSLDDQAIIEVFERVGYAPSNSELQGYRVAAGNRHHRVMPDATLMAFLEGLELYYRGARP